MSSEDEDPPPPSGLQPIAETNSVVFDVADVEGGVPTPNPSAATTRRGRLSVRSQSYDFFNRGVLDNTQQALLQRDQSGRGHLNNAELYTLMREYMTATATMSNYRKLILV